MSQEMIALVAEDLFTFIINFNNSKAWELGGLLPKSKIRGIFALYNFAINF